MNVELPRREEDLSTADPALGPPLLITKETLVKSTCTTKTVKLLVPQVCDRNVESIFRYMQ